MEAFQPGDPAFGPMGEQVFGFLNRHAHEHYSDRTMMAIIRQTGAGTARVLLVDSEPAVIDRLTEVKRGGIRSAAVVLRDGRVIMAVRPDLRRSGLGTNLLRAIFRSQRYAHNEDIQIQLWCHQRNTVGTTFLVSQGLVMSAMRPNGAIMYTSQSTEAWD